MCRDDLVDAAVGHALLARAARTLGPEPETATGAPPRWPTSRAAPRRAPRPAAAAVLALGAAAAGRGCAAAAPAPRPCSRATETRPPQRSAPLQAVAGAGDGTRLDARGRPAAPRMTISTHDLPAAHDGQFYYAWLLDPTTNKMLPLGQVGPAARPRSRSATTCWRRTPPSTSASRTTTEIPSTHRPRCFGRPTPDPHRGTNTPHRRSTTMRYRSILGSATAGAVLTAAALVAAGAAPAQAAPPRGSGTSAWPACSAPTASSSTPTGRTSTSSRPPCTPWRQPSRTAPCSSSTDGTKRLTAFVPTDKAFRNLVKDLTGKSYGVGEEGRSPSSPSWPTSTPSRPSCSTTSSRVPRSPRPRPSRPTGPS